MPFIQGRFPTYKAFADATLEGIYGDALHSALKLRATTFASTLFINTKGHFDARPLPMTAQMSATRSMVLMDADTDGKMDLFLAGNLYGSEAETPRYDAGMGLLMHGDGKGGFVAVEGSHSGVRIPFDTRHVLPITIAGRGPCVLAVNNNGPLMVFAAAREAEHP